MNFTPPSNWNGTADEKLRQCYSYLFRLSEVLNVAADEIQTTSESSFTNMESSVGTKIASLSTQSSAQGDALKSLIIKNATDIQNSMDTAIQKLSGKYVAQSEFGTYVKDLSSTIVADPDLISDYYSFVSTLETAVKTAQGAADAAQGGVDAINTTLTKTDYKTITGFIKSGAILYDDNGDEVIGIAIGQNMAETKYGTDGTKTVIRSPDFMVSVTPKKISFWQNQLEIATLSNSALSDIKTVSVSDEIDLGNWHVSKEHGLTIKWIGA